MLTDATDTAAASVSSGAASPTAPTTHAEQQLHALKDNDVKPTVLDEPWHRPGAFAYARKRRRAAVHPPVTVYPMGSDVTKDEDVAVQMRDGVTLRLNLFRPAGQGPVSGDLVGAPLRQGLDA